MLLHECQLSDLDVPGMYPEVIDHAGLNGAIRNVRFRAAAAPPAWRHQGSCWWWHLEQEPAPESCIFVISMLYLVGIHLGGMRI